nr:MAG TPA_asm: hypothetical protein [Caudoviricetes sp.]
MQALFTKSCNLFYISPSFLTPAPSILHNSLFLTCISILLLYFTLAY